ncbi:hypothetical protein QBC47DRAFT_385929 [Echria macrotheca]|uniref:NACHT domain-containing protein n=1 Tax=Echria macrotheca TaxID=438768 RepID=A0AAJ0FAI5_9PEZI|nr:hypothetical protein QBC47DRAFT_385929 [Echria macrotheca]
MISRDPRTAKQLTTASGSPIILSHFIWNAGHPMEAKIKGLLCSLLHQLIDAVPDLTSHIIHTYPDVYSKEAESDWAYDELREILLSALASVPGPVCIFVDGLDEIDPLDGQADLLRLLADLRNSPHIKMCVASRPEPTLQRSLGHFPGFRMQDLTLRDIETFAADRFDTIFACLGAPYLSSYQSLLKEVSFRAEGVFLWAVLVLKSLERGLNNGDDPKDLERRLQTLPSDLGALYRELWSRLGEDEKIYRKDASKYLGLVFHCLSWKKPRWGLALHSTTTLLRISLASEPELANRILCGNLEPIQDWKTLSDWCATTARRIETRCAGLLEVSSNPYEPWRDVQFVHRSVKEFLENDDEGRKLLTDGGSAESVFVNVYTAALAAESVPIYLDSVPLQSVYRSTMELFEPLVAAVDNRIVSESTSLGLLRKCHALFQSVTSSSPWKSLHHTPAWCEELNRVDTAGMAASYGCLLFLQKLLEWDRPLLETRQRPSAQYMAYLLICLYDYGYAVEKRIQTSEWIFQHEIELNTLCVPRKQWSHFSKLPHHGLYLEPVTPLQLATKIMLLENVWDRLGMVKRILHASTDLSTPMILSLVIAPPDKGSYCDFVPLPITTFPNHQLTVALETNTGFVLKLALDLLAANTKAARLDAELLSSTALGSSSSWQIARGAIYSDDRGRKCHEITGSQGESVICFLKQKSRLMEGRFKTRTCPGLYSMVEGMVEEGTPVTCDESGHTKFPFSYPAHVTLLTPAQGRLRAGSGLAQDCSGLLTLRAISGRLRRSIPQLSTLAE